MRKFTNLLTVLTLICCCGGASAHVFDWARQLRGTALSEGLGITTDRAGNVYAVGTFYGTTDFNPLPGAADTFSLTASTGNTAYVVKLNPAGELIWAKKAAGSANANNSYATAVSTDDAGNVYVTGWFGGKVDFDPGPDTFFLSTPATNNADVFFLKLDPDGNFVWAKQIASAGNGDGAGDIVVFGENIYATGHFSGKADFDPGPDTSYLTAAGLDIYVLKLDTTGGFVWARQMGGSMNDYGTGVTTDASGSVYTTGYYRGTADFDPGTGSYPFTSGGNDDIFVSKLDPDGNFVWAISIGGPQADQGQAIVTDGRGSLYITGSFRANIDFDASSAGVHYVASFSGNKVDAFTMSYDTAGNFSWVRRLGGTDDDRGVSIGTDGAGNVYTFGLFVDSATVDTTSSYLLSAGGPGDIDLFITKMDRTGELIWAKSFGGDQGWEQPQALTVDRSGNVYTTGSFELESDFDPEATTYLLEAGGDLDPFIHKLYCNDTNLHLFTATSCSGSYTFNGETLTTSGTYTWTYPNVVGCDSTVILDLTVFTIVHPTLNVSGYDIETAVAYTSYQWLRNDTAIPGATSRQYTVTQNAIYRVAVTDANGCADTSDPYTVTNVGIGDAQIAAHIHVYPNPVSKNIHVQAPLPVTLTITGVEGRVLRRQSNTNSLVVEDLPQGVYLLQIADEQGVLLKTVKFVKN